MKKKNNPSAVAEICRRLEAAEEILIISHLHPDGDAIGSLLGLGTALQETGKVVEMVSIDGVPGNLRHLTGWEEIHKRPRQPFDLMCVVDCSEFSRVGDLFADEKNPDINIDHHATNENFAQINLVVTEAVATAEIILDLVKAMKIPVSQPVASALLTGLITDTIGFRTSNMTPRSLRLAAELMERGANLPDLYKRTLIDRTFEAVCLWGAGFSKLTRQGRMAWTTLTKRDRENANYPGLDDADITIVLSAIQDIDVSLVFIEHPGGIVKVSWRSQPGFDVSRIALKFGGGGHPAASGAEIKGTIEDVQPLVLSETRTLFAGGTS